MAADEKEVDLMPGMEEEAAGGPARTNGQVTDAVPEANAAEAEAKSTEPAKVSGKAMVWCLVPISLCRALYSK